MQQVYNLAPTNTLGSLPKECKLQTRHFLIRYSTAAVFLRETIIDTCDEVIKGEQKLELLILIFLKADLVD